ncbi:hypothetical protein KEM52_003027 [Ascosphaera acerosa]|nr:hypothetical protein KEM52_003027 [Ascosphaera acerosa]
MSPVSPYNLRSMRVLHGLTGLLLLATTAWYLLLLVSLFVTLPGMSSRGSGFFPLAWAAHAIATVLVGFVFFAVPSAPLAVCSAAAAFFLLLNALLLLCTPRIRLEEGWAGMASVGAALALAAYLLLQTRSVGRRVRREERRLTGREEARRPLREWLLVALQLAIMAVLVAVPVLTMSTLALRARDASLAPPGTRYWVQRDSMQVHLHCVGDAGANVTTVIAEAGEAPAGAGLAQWLESARRAGRLQRYCTWDRPGVGFSDNAPSPYAAGRSADVLSEALHAAGEDRGGRRQYVVVGAGMGGVYGRVFAGRRAAQVRGLLLVDAVGEAMLPRVGGAARGFRLWLRGLFAPLGLDRLPGAIFRGRTRRDRVQGRCAYQGDRFLKAALQENLVANSLTRPDLARADEALDRRLPLAVVAAGREVERDKQWARAQEQLRAVSDNLLSWTVVKGAPHEVWESREGKRVLDEQLRRVLEEGAKQ